MVVLRGEGFVLRQYRKGDEQSLLKHIVDPEIYRNTMTIPRPYTIKDARWWIQHCLENYRKRNRESYVFALTVKNEVVGSVGLHHIEKHQAEIGYWLGRAFWGQGLMTAAVELVTDYAFDELKVNRVYAKVFSFNKGSARVLEKAGYEYEGTHRKSARKDGKLLDEKIFARIR